MVNTNYRNCPTSLIDCSCGISFIVGYYANSSCQPHQTKKGNAKEVIEIKEKSSGNIVAKENSNEPYCKA